MRTFCVEVEVVESVTRIYAFTVEVEDDEVEDEARDLAYENWYEYNGDEVDSNTESVSVESCEEEFTTTTLPPLIGGELI